MLVRYALYKALRFSLECSRKALERVADHDWEYTGWGTRLGERAPTARWRCAACGHTIGRVWETMPVWVNSADPPPVLPPEFSVDFPCLAKIGGLPGDE